MARKIYNCVPTTRSLGTDKISVSGQGIGIANYATFPVLYGTGARQLGLKPAVAFSVDVRSGGTPLTTQFVDLSENNPTSWSWTFQGGSPATSNQQHPKVTYNVPGSYPVKLIATNSYGSHEIVKQEYVTVGTTGIRSTVQEIVSIFPNPTTDYVWVQGAGCEIIGYYGESYSGFVFRR
jgi:PKD repeat protein